MSLDLATTNSIRLNISRMQASLLSGIERSIGSSIIVSALAAGIWTELAFFHKHGKLIALLISLFAGCCFAGCFSATLLLAKIKVPAGQLQERLCQNLARCSFASIVLVIFIPEYLVRSEPPYLRSALLLAITTTLWLALCVTCILNERKVLRARVANKFVHTMAGTGLITLFSAMTALAIRKYLVFGYVGQDLAYFGQIMYTTIHGHLFWGNLLQDLIYSQSVNTDFAGHNSPVMFLYLPFYALFPSPITLLVIRNLVMISCALPVFLIARRHFSVPTAWLWSAVFLLTPAILYQSIFDFYPLSLVALPLLFTLYFYLDRRYVAFSAAMSCTLLVREDMVFFIFGLGLLALFERRRARWILGPLAVATAWAVVSFCIVLPRALHGATFVTDACFSHLGSSTSQMVQSVITHPCGNVLVHGNVVYLKTLLTSTGLLFSFGSPVTLLCLPFLAINLLAGAGHCITTVIFAQYSVVPATLLFASTLIGAPAARRLNCLAFIGRLGLPHETAQPLLLLALCCGSLVFVTGKTQVDELRTQPWNKEARHVLDLIPTGASVAAPRYMLPHLANRDCLYQTHRLLQYHSAVYEFLIIDTNWDHINASEEYHLQYAQVMDKAAGSSSLVMIYNSPLYHVYQDSAGLNKQCNISRKSIGKSNESMVAYEH